MAALIDGPIKPEAIARLADRLELDMLEAETLEYIVQSVDAAYLVASAKKAARNNR